MTKIPRITFTRGKDKHCADIKPYNNKTKLVISCFYNSLSPPPDLPVGFNWTQVLVQDYSQIYDVTILIHGENIPYSLNDVAYQAKYGTPNPFADFLTEMKNKYKVKIVVCHLCLTNDGFTDSELLSFIQPVPFSINFIAQSQLRGDLVIYDAQLAA